MSYQAGLDVGKYTRYFNAGVNDTIRRAELLKHGHDVLVHG